MSEQTTQKLGKLLAAAEPRDAVHIAVVAVVAEHSLEPGRHIGFVDGSTERVDYAGQGVRPIGIVDPFLTAGPTKDQWFWMFLYPGSITSLRHDWTHPAFKAEPAPDQMAVSVAWLRNWCQERGLGYGDTEQAYRRLVDDSNIYGSDDTDVDEEFRNHYFVVTGKSEVFFSCSC